MLKNSRTNGFFLALTLLASLFSPSPFKSASAQEDKSPSQPTLTRSSINGLKRPVTVRRDERGVSYIEAENLEDLYFMQGYVTAGERLWQMELLRRTARGELAEIFGKLALEEDKRRRTYGYARAVEKMAERGTKEARDALDSYVAGVNAYIDSLDENSLPPEFKILGFRPRRWTAADSHAAGMNFSEVLSMTWRIDLLRSTLSDLPPEKLKELLPVKSPLDVIVVGSDGKESKPESNVKEKADGRVSQNLSELLKALAAEEEIMRRSQRRIGLYAEDFAASNNWVVSGRHTATGKPLLANDPHLSPSAPSIWHMIHLSAPGLRVAGVVAPSAPGVIIGHNERIAWGVTNLGPDVQDLYLEKFDKDNPRRYRTPEGFREAEVIREEIKVRKSFASKETETVVHEVTLTRNGPVVFERDGARYSLRWPALDPQNLDLDGFYYLNRARDWKEFRAALEHYKGPTQNFIYADREGHIGYYGAGLIPLRKTGDGSLPFDGSTDEGEWTGYIPFNELPNVLDPPSGIIVTANSRVVGDSYKHHLSHVWASPTRARRIFDLLSAKKNLTIEDFLSIQGDAFSITGDMFAREFSKTLRSSGATNLSDALKADLKTIESWDGRLEPESRAALLVGEIRYIFLQQILTSALGEERAKSYTWPNSASFVHLLIKDKPRAWLPEKFKSYAELLIETHRLARERLTKRLGADESQWSWGRDNRVEFSHPLTAIPFIGKQFYVEMFPQRGSEGGMATVNVGESVSLRYVADLADWNRTRMGIAPGQSGLPSSPHFQDQLSDWKNVAPRPFPFSKEAVSSATKEIRIFAPKP